MSRKRDEELDDILPEDHGGRYILEPAADGPIERVAPGIYKKSPQGGKGKAVYLKYRGVTRGQTGTEVEGRSRGASMQPIHQQAQL